MRILIDEAAYRKLVAGQEVTLRTPNGVEVTLLLADIGWSAMLTAIDAAITGQMHEALKHSAKRTARTLEDINSEQRDS